MTDITKANLWDFIKGGAILVLTLGVSIKLYNLPITLNIDFPTLLSLLLALFSVGLSALFYFKATDTSNNFYDNTYKFTKDIAELLVKMESGFGERLRNLDEGYNSMRGYFQNGFVSNGKATDTVEDTTQQLKTEKEEMRKAVEERNEIVKGLIERSQLEAEEKERISSLLKTKETEITELQSQVTRLNRRRAFDRVRGKTDGSEESLRTRVRRHLEFSVIESLGGASQVSKLPIATIVRRFQDHLTELPNAFIDDLEELGYYDGDRLTPIGARFIRQTAS